MAPAAMAASIGPAVGPRDCVEETVARAIRFPPP
jgi:hypothetical protein